MQQLNLMLACGRYDRTVALRTGEIAVEGIEVLVEYMVEQHLIARPIPIDDLFVPCPV